eukprot:750033-Hanusia_phi.AAC.1
MARREGGQEGRSGEENDEGEEDEQRREGKRGRKGRKRGRKSPVDVSEQGSVGFITSMSQHFCGSCNRLRITADG